MHPHCGSTQLQAPQEMMGQNFPYTSPNICLLMLPDEICNSGVTGRREGESRTRRWGWGNECADFSLCPLLDSAEQVEGKPGTPSPFLVSPWEHCLPALLLSVTAVTQTQHSPSSHSTRIRFLLSSLEASSRFGSSDSSDHLLFRSFFCFTTDRHMASALGLP